MKIDVSLSPMENLTALINEVNPTSPVLDAASVQIKTAPTPLAAQPYANSTVTLEPAPTARLEGELTLAYRRVPLADLANTMQPVVIAPESTAADFLQTVGLELGLYGALTGGPSDIALVDPFTPPAIGEPVDGTLSVVAAVDSIFYTPTPLTVDVQWPKHALSEVVPMDMSDSFATPASDYFADDYVDRPTRYVENINGV